MTDVVLGKLIDSPQERDAVHVATVPMTAAELLRPAQRVGIVGEGIAGPSANVVGIVDPYLTDVVPKGAQFWLCLLPGTVTGMRHHWAHPAFNSSAAPVGDKAASEAWLKGAAKTLGVPYEELISDHSPLVTSDYINNGEHIRDLWYEMDDEFWKHHKIVTGRDVPEDDRGGFTCSC